MYGEIKVKTIEIDGRITPAGTLEATLPPGLPPGEVKIRIEIAQGEEWLEGEIDDLLKSSAPMSGHQIVKAGLLGGWQTLNISGGGEWVEENRRQQLSTANTSLYRQSEAFRAAAV
jgi:hypothetical protein